MNEKPTPFPRIFGVLPLRHRSNVHLVFSKLVRKRYGERGLFLIQVKKNPLSAYFTTGLREEDLLKNEGTISACLWNQPTDSESKNTHSRVFIFLTDGDQALDNQLSQEFNALVGKLDKIEDSLETHYAVVSRNLHKFLDSHLEILDVDTSDSKIVNIHKRHLVESLLASWLNEHTTVPTFHSVEVKQLYPNLVDDFDGDAIRFTIGKNDGESSSKIY